MSWYEPLLIGGAQLQDAGGVPNDVCTAVGFAIGSPVIGSPALRQNHVITGSAFAVGSPVIGSPAINQNHILTGAGFAVGSPVIGSASFPGAGNDVCAAVGFSVGSPVIGASALNQNHVVTGSSFAVGSPVIGSAALFGNTVITAVGFAVGSPVIGAAPLAGEFDPGLPSGDIGGGRNRDAGSRWLEIERARLKREKARRRSAEKAIAEALKAPPKSAQAAAGAISDLSDGARVTLAALLDGMAPQTATVIADQLESVLAARSREATARAKKEAEAARLWLAEVQAVLDEQARIQAEDDDVLMLLLAA